MVTRNSNDITCFDVFDTLVARRVMFPSDVFRRNYARLRHDGFVCNFTEDEFVSLRMQTERKIVAQLVECTLLEIWEAMAPALEIPEASIGMEKELEAERAVLFPIQAGLELLASERARAGRIAFISDTPLPESFVRQLLTDFSILQDDDLLFISSTIRKTKRDGSLYTHVSKALGSSPDRFRMIGDNLHSDVRMAKAAGWQAIPFMVSRPTAAETHMAKNLRLPPMQRSLIAGAARAHRLGTASAAPAGDDVVAGFVAPCSLLWAIWSLQEAKRQGLERLYFMSRDAYLASVAAKTLGQFADVQVDCRYLMASRRALSSIAVDHAEPHEIEALMKPYEVPDANLLGMLNSIGLNATDLPKEINIAELNARSENVAELARHASEIACNEDVQEILVQRRANVMAYLASVGLNDPVRSAIVDLGWHLSAQRILRRALPAKKLTGLYVYVNCNRYPVPETGSAIAMMPMVAQDANIKRPLESYATLLEHLLGLAPHGTVRGYSLDSDGSKADAKPVSAAIEALLGQAERYFHDNASTFWLTFKTPEEAARAFQEVMEFFLSEPKLFDLKAIGAIISASPEADNRNSLPLVEPYSLFHAVWYLLPRRLHPLYIRPRIWSAGSLAGSSPMVRMIFRVRNFVGSRIVA